MQIRNIVLGETATGMTMVGAAMAMPKTFAEMTVNNAYEVALPGDLVTTPSIAAFLRNDWAGLSSYAMGHPSVPEWMQSAAQFAADNVTVVVGHVAPAVALVH
jgi:hypothetical protein